MVIVVKLLASYFKNNRFHNISYCPLALAIRYAFGTNDVQACIYRSYINRESYMHEAYDHDTFYKDMELAKRANFDETIIRQIEIVKY